jgi:cell division protein FtsW
MISPLSVIKLRAFLLLLALSLFGLMMVYSSSYIYSHEIHGSSHYFFYRHGIYLLLAFFLLVMGAQIPLQKIYDYSVPIMLFSCLLLALTFVPQLSSTANGARRWLRLGLFSFQPGELLKLVMIPYSFYFFDHFFSLKLHKKILLSCLTLLPMLLLGLQPDFGTLSICFMVCCFTCFTSRFPKKIFYALSLTGVISLAFILTLASYRVKRILTFLDPWKDPRDTGFQIIQSYLAFANGSFFGQGLGNSHEKLFYLPEAHNDFILSVIGEEFGFVGIFLLVLLYLFFFYNLLKMTLFQKDRVKFYLSLAVIFMIGLQVILNMGVVLGLLPTKGLNLPFISYGGSSLMCNFLALALIYGIKAEKKSSSEEVKSVYT